MDEYNKSLKINSYSVDFSENGCPIILPPYNIMFDNN